MQGKPREILKFEKEGLVQIGVRPGDDAKSAAKMNFIQSLILRLSNSGLAFE